MFAPHLHPHSSADGVPTTCHDTYAGIHWPASPGGLAPPDGWSWVERCDDCAVYDDDEHAAIVLILELGRPHLSVAWFDRATLTQLPGYRSGASVAINFTPAEA